MAKALPIWEASYTAVKELMALMDQRFPGTSQKIFDTDHVHILVRFLKYDWKACGKYLELVEEPITRTPPHLEPIVPY